MRRSPAFSSPRRSCASVVGQLAELPALQTGPFVVAHVELGDQARGVRPEGARARLHRRAGGAHVRELGEAPLELLQALAVGRGAAAGGLALLGRARRRGAALLELHAAAGHQGQGRRVRGLRLVQGRLGVGGGRPQLLGLQQRVRRRDVGGLLAGGRLGQLGGDALHGAPVALQVLLEVAAAGADLRRARAPPSPPRCAPRARLRPPRPQPPRAAAARRPAHGGLFAQLPRRHGVDLLAEPLERSTPLEQQGGGHPAREADLTVGRPVVFAILVTASPVNSAGTARRSSTITTSASAPSSPSCSPKLTLSAERRRAREGHGRPPAAGTMRRTSPTSRPA